MAKRPDETHGRPIKDTGKPNGLTFPSGFPGQLGLLAKQMNSGFGGGLLAQRNYLNQMYDPVKINQLPTSEDPTKPTLNPDDPTADKPINTWRLGNPQQQMAMAPQAMSPMQMPGINPQPMGQQQQLLMALRQMGYMK